MVNKEQIYYIYEKEWKHETLGYNYLYNHLQLQDNGGLSPIEDWEKAAALVYSFLLIAWI